MRFDQKKRLQERIRVVTLRVNGNDSLETSTRNIAQIDRLKQRLNLPKIESRPPCGPKIYKKLYAYLDGALLATRSIEPSSALHKSAPPPKAPQKLQDGNRSVPTIQAGKVVPSHKRKVHIGLNSTDTNPHGDENIPDWLISSLRQLCKQLNAPTAYPHVYTGILSVAQVTTQIADKRPAKRGTRDAFHVQTDDLPERDWPALIIAVLLIVLANMPSSLEPSESIGPAVQILIDLERVNVADADQVVASVEELLEVEGPRWEEMEWFKSMADSGSCLHDEPFSDDDLLNESLTAVNQAAASHHEVSTSRRIHNRNTEQIQALHSSVQVGLGTMMQDKVHWLSESRQVDFVRWKAHILKKIELIEQERSMEKT